MPGDCVVVSPTCHTVVHVLGHGTRPSWEILEKDELSYQFPFVIVLSFNHSVGGSRVNLGKEQEGSRKQYYFCYKV